MRWKPQCSLQELEEYMNQVGHANASAPMVHGVSRMIVSAFAKAIYQKEGGMDRDKVQDSEVFTIDEVPPPVPPKREPSKMWGLLEKKPELWFLFLGTPVVLAVVIIWGIWLLSPDQTCPRCGLVLNSSTPGFKQPDRRQVEERNR